MNKPSAWNFNLREMFTLDLRSLALFRICLALLLLSDLAVRATSLRAHYTDSGVLPCAALEAGGHPSIHVLSGSLGFQAVLFLAAAACAGALLVGYHTRAATVFSWFLLMSLQARNPVILHGGDVLLRLLVFWGMFLPLGACFSVDAALESPYVRGRWQFFSAAVVALILQVCFVYWFTFLLKKDACWRVDGTAVYYALSIDEFVTPLGKFMLHFPTLLKVMTFATLAIEVGGPFLLFMPRWTGPVRTAVVFLFIVFHIFGLGSCLTLGSFSFICAAAWVSLLPAWFWERLRPSAAAGLTIYYDGRAGLGQRLRLLRTFLLQPEVPVTAVPCGPGVLPAFRLPSPWVMEDDQGRAVQGWQAVKLLIRRSPWRRTPCHLVGARMDRQESLASSSPLEYASASPSWLMTAVLTMLIVYVFQWNMRSLNFERYSRFFPRQCNGVGVLLGLDQYWAMFAPYPAKVSGWYVVRGVLENGCEVDVAHDGLPICWEKPELVSATFPDTRWRKYLGNLCMSSYAGYRSHYATYLWNEWDRRHANGQHLQELEIWFVQQETLPDYRKSPPEKVLLYRDTATLREDQRPAQHRCASS